MSLLKSLICRVLVAWTILEFGKICENLVFITSKINELVLLLNEHGENLVDLGKRIHGHYLRPDWCILTIEAYEKPYDIINFSMFLAKGWSDKHIWLCKKIVEVVEKSQTLAIFSWPLYCTKWWVNLLLRGWRSLLED